MTHNKDDTMGSVAIPDVPEIVTAAKAITVRKGNGTAVSYYIFPEFEVHDNSIPPGSSQEWHFHKHIEEIIFVTSGEVAVEWLDKNKQKVSKTLHVGDLCRVGRSVHKVSNRTESPATFLVYRLVPRRQNQHELIKTDRHPVDVG